MSSLLSNSSRTAENCLKQSIQDLYVKLFDHSISEITCWSMAEGIVTVILEDVTTLPERLLIEGGYQQTAVLFRKELMQIFKKRLKSVFSKYYQGSPDDILSQYHPETGLIGAMIIQK